MSLEPGLVDANVLAYAVDTRAPQHAAASALLDSGYQAATTLYVSSQILCEFYSVVTNRRRVARPLSADDARKLVTAHLQHLRVLPMHRRSVDILMELLEQQPVTGSDIFDLQIVATMRANDIHRIYTFNANDFRVFPGLEVVVPG